MQSLSLVFFAEEALKRELAEKEREIQSLRDQVAMGRGRDANSPIDLS